MLCNWPHGGADGNLFETVHADVRHFHHKLKHKIPNDWCIWWLAWLYPTEIHLAPLYSVWAFKKIYEFPKIDWHINWKWKYEATEVAALILHQLFWVVIKILWKNPHKSPEVLNAFWGFRQRWLKFHKLPHVMSPESVLVDAEDYERPQQRRRLKPVSLLCPRLL